MPAVMVTKPWLGVADCAVVQLLGVLLPALLTWYVAAHAGELSKTQLIQRRRRIHFIGLLSSEVKVKGAAAIS